jgi:Tfp pilus assembly protein PilP
MKKYLVLISFFTISLVFSAQAEEKANEERDPFAPSSGKAVQTNEVSTKSSEDQTSLENLSPKTAYKTTSYKVVGVIIANEKKLAAVKALNGADYIVSVGDELGNNHGKVSDIDISSITIKNNEGEVKIPVSNKLNLGIDKK